MHARLYLDHTHDHYTNLDVLNGRVQLQIPNPVNVTSIVVKLEGEARTRLMTAIKPSRTDKQRPVLEVHKFLYKTQVVWPAGMQQDELLTNTKQAFPLDAGKHEYPFQFKLPLNMGCQQQNSLSTNVSFSNMIPEYGKNPTQHVKTTLPPSLSGFPGEAEIRYFVKVTVNRPEFYKENPRDMANFTFLPIEPPRPAQTDGEAYARRSHQFLEGPPGSSGGKKGFFGHKDPTAPDVNPNHSPRVSVDARLPNPAILTINQALPLKILVKNMGERSKNIYLQMLQIELIGYTKVRAHEVTRTESNSWLLASMSNMAIPIGSPTDAVGTEVPINQEYWSDKLIPNTVAPSFQACNLSRSYEIEVRVGLGYGSYNHGEDQLVVLPLRLPVKLYSGIAPPQALLEASSTGGTPTAAAAGKPNFMQQPYIGSNLRPQQPNAGPTMATSPSQGKTGADPFPPQGAAGTQQEAVPEDAPPSYEEAVGANLPPINGYRGSYMPPPVPEGAPRFSEDRKR
ncbi:unnamed protein product [Periconia digitata]|uniref:Arrestin-like N-terminal domain-containing protein n=1 Tax=Periconia digitata TaxID=1303443 RepID=A0A9W4UMK3_9PLEO|nr:unnamed protein product [Periconia digitata]